MVVPPGGSPDLLARDLATAQDTFEGFPLSTDGGFILLGSAFGPEPFCEALTAKRSDKAQHILARLRGMQDSQSALLLLRYCANYCKLVYSARTTPMPTAPAWLHTEIT